MSTTAVTLLTEVNCIQREEQENNDDIEDYPSTSVTEQTPAALELQLRYESLLAEYRMMRFKLPLYKKQWNDVCRQRRLKRTSTVYKRVVAPEETRGLRDSLVKHIRDLAITDPLPSSCSSQDLVRVLVNHSLYDLFRNLKQDMQSFAYIVDTLQYFVDTVRSWTMWRYGNSTSVIEKQVLLEESFEPTEFETNQQSYQQVILQLGTLAECKRKSEQDLKELMQRFFDLQTQSIKNKQKQIEYFDDVVDFIGNDMHTMQLKQIEQTIRRYSVEMDALTKQKAQLEQVLPLGIST